MQALGSQQDLNFRVDSDQGRFVLKICRGDYSALELQAQHAGLKHLAEHPDVHVPRVIPAKNGADLLSLEVAGQAVHVRLLDYIEGTVADAPGSLPAFGGGRFRSAVW